MGKQGKQQEFLYAHRVVTKIVDAYLSNFVGASQHAECRGLLKEYAGGYLETCGSGADGFGRLSSRARAWKPHNPHAYMQFYQLGKARIFFRHCRTWLGAKEKSGCYTLWYSCRVCYLLKSPSSLLQSLIP